MITLVIIAVILAIAELLQIYKGSSPVLAFLMTSSQRGFRHLSTAGIENIKKYLRYTLLWLSVDLFMSGAINHKLFGNNPTHYLLGGCACFFMSLYMVTPKQVFDKVKKQINWLSGQIVPIGIFFAAGAYLFASMTPADLAGSHYANLPEQLQLSMINVTKIFFMAVAVLITGLLVVSVAFKYFVYFNYRMSNLVGHQIIRISSHCVTVLSNEPHRVINAWLTVITILFGAIMFLLAIFR
jgi:hypothetical protein